MELLHAGPGIKLSRLVVVVWKFYEGVVLADSYSKSRGRNVAYEPSFRCSDESQDCLKHRVLRERAGVKNCRSGGVKLVASLAPPFQLTGYIMGIPKEKLGGIDLLVCNAGGSQGAATLEATDEEWIATLDVNLLHSVRTIRAAVPHMAKRGGGSIVIVSSISGWKPGPRGQYGTAKAAEIFLAGTLAWELAGHNIRVNTVSPGSISRTN